MANRFWVLGTGTWDASDTTHWSATTGGAGGASVPGSGDAVTLDANSGGGTITVNFGGLITIQSLGMSNFAGTLDFATNNNSITLTTSATALAAAGSATQTLNMGSGTWTISGATSSGNAWVTTNTNLTLNAGTSTLVFTGNIASDRVVSLGAKTYNIVSLQGTGSYRTSVVATTISELRIGAGVNLTLGAVSTITLTTLSTTATLSAPSSIMTTTNGSEATIAGNGTYSVSNMAFKDIDFTGGNTRTATNSFDFGNNTGITITPPSAAGSGGGVIGS